MKMTIQSHFETTPLYVSCNIGQNAELNVSDESHFLNVYKDKKILCCRGSKYFLFFNGLVHDTYEMKVILTLNEL